MSQSPMVVSCACTAQYMRMEVRLPIKDIGVFECGYCGAEVARWHGRLVPAFELHAPPTVEREPEAA